MATIPLPALDVRPAPNPLEEYAKIAGIKSMMMQQQNQQQEIQQRQLLMPGQQQAQQQQLEIGAADVKLKNIEVKDRELLTQLYPQFTKKTSGGDSAGRPSGYDYDALTESYINGGGSIEGLSKVNAIRSQNAEMAIKLAQQGEQTIKEHQAANSALNDAIDTLQNIPDVNARKQALPGLLLNLQKMGVDTSKLGQAEPTDDNLARAQATLGMHQEVVANATKLAAMQKAQLESKGSPEVQAQQAWLKKNPGKDASDYAIMMKKLPITFQRDLLTPEATDMAAENYFQTGQLPAGMRSPAMSASIISRAAQLHPNATTELAGNRASYEANKKSYDNVTTTLDTLSAFEQSGLKNLKQFTDLANKLPDTGVPWLNTPVRNLNKNLVGAEYMPAIEAARSVALREIARVTNDPKLSGSLTDSARGEVAAFSPMNATLPQIKRVVEVLQNDMANVHSSLAAQKQDIGARLGIKSGSGAIPAEATHIGPDNKPYKYKGSGDRTDPKNWEVVAP